jgi:RND family efflux transporter MFP subunit
VNKHDIHTILKSAAVFPLLLLLTACGGSDDGDGDTNTRLAVPVLTERAETRDVQQTFYSIGRLVSRNSPVLAAEINARVVDVLVDAGDTVEQGQVLVRLDTTVPQLTRREALAEIERLEINISNEERRVKRYRDLQSRELMPQERLDDAEAKLASDRAALNAAAARLAIAEDHLTKAALTSPVSGAVERRHVSVGDYVKVGAPLLSVTDTHNLRAELPFPETVGEYLEIGQRLLLESPLAPGRVVESRVGGILPEVGMMNRAMLTIADVKNPGFWRPEATVEGTVVVDSRPGAVVVPVMSVIERPSGQVVYVPEGETVRQRVVETGQRQNGWIEVLSGIEPGTVVVTDGARYLSDGAAIMVRVDQDE